MTNGAHSGFPWIVPVPIWYGRREEEHSRQQGYDLQTLQVVNCILTKLSGLYMGSTVSLVAIAPLHEIISIIHEHQDLYKQCLCELYGRCEGVSWSGKANG